MFHAVAVWHVLHEVITYKQVGIWRVPVIRWVFGGF